ncbi:MAG: hypothetical protein ACI9DC_001290 [Gammaproteobacteria bacterium]|jgi:hypothetical protein
MGKKQQVPNRQYTDEFKIEAGRLAESIGGNIVRSRMWLWMPRWRACTRKVTAATVDHGLSSTF